MSTGPTSDDELRLPAADTPATPAAKASRRRKRSVLFAGVLSIAAIFTIVLIAAMSLRVGVQTSPGRAVISRLIEGLKLSRFGRLHVEGLQGDLLSDFSIRRVTITDEKGVWLEIADLAVRWDSPELLARRFHAQRIRAGAMRVLRRPILIVEPVRPPQPNALAVALDDVRLSLETLPAFSVSPGLWDIAGQAVIERTGPARGRMDATSLLHKGDGATLVFRLGDKREVVLRADAVEGEGGALAGSLGLAADRRLEIHATADGTGAQGQLSFTTASGQTIPARAEARWSPTETTFEGYITLAASRHTQRFVERMGPEARLRIVARHTRGDLYEIDGSLMGPFANIAAKGPIDWRRRRTAGLDVKLAFANLSKWWVPVPKVGPARATGVLVGDPARFTYKGSMAVETISQWDYVLARAAGPATFTRKPGEWRLQADLRGEGGRSTGGQGGELMAALLGPGPTAVLDGARIADGRFLFRRLLVDGPGLKIDAEGGQGLLGGLTFKGKARVSNLAAAHKGAKGVLVAGWQASEPKGVHLWGFDFDAKGTDFATGFSEFDRLLGTTPTITAKASYGAPGWTVVRGEMTGGALNIVTKGTIDRALTMALDLDWRAQGPFSAGPVQIDGRVNGGGRVGGKFGRPWADLTADLVQIDFGRLAIKPAHMTVLFQTAPEGATGQLSLSGPSNYGPAAGRSAFRFLPDGLALSEINADAGGVKLAGDVTLRNGSPSTADLTMAAGPGAFLATGKLTGAVKIVDRGAGGPTADIAFDGQDLSLPGVARNLPVLHLKAQGPWARLPFEVSAQSDEVLDWRFAGRGLVNQATAVREISLSGQGRVKRADLRMIEPAVFRMGPDEKSLRLRVQLGSGRADIDAVQRGETLQAKAEMKDLALAAFDQDFVGQFDASLALQGRADRLTGGLDATLAGARSRDALPAQALAGRIRATLNDGTLHLDAGATNSQGLKSQLLMDIPATASAAPFRLYLVGDKPLRGSFDIDGELRPLFDLWAGGARTLSGRMVAKGTIAGTLANMESVGAASLTGGRLQDVATGLDLRELEIQASFGQSAVTVNRFSGVDGRGGSVTGEGRASLFSGGASTLTLNLSRFQLVDNEIARATASGPVTVTRDANGRANLKGELTIDRADIVAKPPVPTGVVRMDVVEVNRPRRTGADPTSKPAGPQIALDVDIDARRGVFVKGNGLDVEFSLKSHVGGNTGQPLLTGEARVVRGDYQFAGKRFDFDDRGVVRLGSTAEAIRIDLSAVRDDPTLTAVVRIQGTAAKPEITLSSTPVLPEDEVLAQVLFGRSASQLSSLEAAQLAAALTTLATGGGFDVLGGLRQLAGLDRLALGGGASGMGVSGGKYLTDAIYLELTGGGREGPTAQVEWRIRRNLSLVSTVSTQGDARLSVRFRKTYN